MIVKMMIFQAIKSAGSAMGFDMSWLGGKSVAAFILTVLLVLIVVDIPEQAVNTHQLVSSIKGEYVLTKEATSRLGVNYLDYLNYQTRSKPSRIFKWWCCWCSSNESTQ